ncbi:unnamed protein product, partial [Discosporangium mesarthrocarpum]
MGTGGNRVSRGHSHAWKQGTEGGGRGVEGLKGQGQEQGNGLVSSQAGMRGPSPIPGQGWRSPGEGGSDDGHSAAFEEGGGVGKGISKSGVGVSHDVAMGSETQDSFSLDAASDTGVQRDGGDL